MDRELFRDAVTTKFRDKFAKRQDCKVQYENEKQVDIGEITQPVIYYEIVYSNSYQADLNAEPFIKDEGNILVTILVKEGTGTKTAIRLREECAVLLQRQFLADATTAIGQMLPNSHLVKGWIGFRVSIPFQHYHF